MLRAIPLPYETIRDLKIENGTFSDPMMRFQLRIRLLLLDIETGEESEEKLLNILQLETLVLEGDWPEC